MPCRDLTTTTTTAPCGSGLACLTRSMSGASDIEGDQSAEAALLRDLYLARVGSSLVPELDVTDLARSLAFYVGVVGFTLVFERPAERFAYLAIDNAELMLQEAAGPGRRFRTAPLERPFGRGINLQILVPNVDATYAAVLGARLEPMI